MFGVTCIVSDDSDFGSVLTPHFHRKGGTCFDFMELHIKITLRQIQQFGERIDGEPRQHNDLLGPLHPKIDTKSENGKLFFPRGMWWWQ